MGSVVLVTGVARHLGSAFVRAVRREPGVELVVGVDVQPSEHDLGGPAPYAFVRADIRRPAIARVIAEYGVDTVVHLNVSTTMLGSTNRSAVKETNVIGSMQLLAAVQQSPGVRRLVVKSTTSVYGSAPRDPAVFAEAMVPKSLPGGGFAKDAVEVEGYVRGFSRRRPDVAVCVLRFANIVGPHADTPLNEYFALPVLPTVLGYDPRLQFVHEDDAVEALRLAVAPGARLTAARSGTFNVAGAGVMALSQAARRLGKPTVPMLLPAVSWMAGLARGTRLLDFSPEQLRMLTHGRVVDTTLLRETFGYTPAFTTAEALADLAGSLGPGLLPPRAVAGLADLADRAVAAFAAAGGSGGGDGGGGGGEDGPDADRTERGGR